MFHLWANEEDGREKKIKWAQNGHPQKIAHFFHKSKNGQPQKKKMCTKWEFSKKIKMDPQKRIILEEKNPN